MASNTAVEEKKGFDSLPIAVQMLVGIGLLLIIAVVGFAIFMAVDIFLLDLDPIGRLVSALTSK
ncbi:MAG: hypothetical protein IJ630_01680 [Treponema sp.]|nr:hypothetical protein [Treponema sp.]